MMSSTSEPREIAYNSIMQNKVFQKALPFENVIGETSNLKHDMLLIFHKPQLTGSLYWNDESYHQLIFSGYYDCSTEAYGVFGDISQSLEENCFALNETLAKTIDDAINRIRDQQLDQVKSFNIKNSILRYMIKLIFYFNDNNYLYDIVVDLTINTDKLTISYKLEVDVLDFTHVDYVFLCCEHNEFHNWRSENFPEHQYNINYVIQCIFLNKLDNDIDVRLINKDNYMDYFHITQMNSI